MPKRRRTDSPERPTEDRRPQRPSKRARLIPSRLLSLPQELLLRILYQLRPATLLNLSLTSKKLHSLSSDPQIWKALFWRRFVQPYVMKFGSLAWNQQRPPSEASSLREWRLWLDDAELLQREREVVAKHANEEFHIEDVGSYNADVPMKPKVVGMDWKGKYRLRHNWQRGACRFGEIDFAPRLEGARNAAVLYHEGYVFSADREHGLQIWSMGTGRATDSTLLCHHPFESSLGTPTCLAIDSIICDDYLSGIKRKEGIQIAVGFDSCTYTILHFRIDGDKAHISQVMQSRASDNTKSTIKLIAYAQSYLCVMTTKPQLFLYHIPIIPRFDGTIALPRMKLVTTLSCEASWNPTAVSIRRDERSGYIIASTVFHVPSQYDCDGLSVQELHVDPQTRRIVSSRVAQSTSPAFLDQPYIQADLSASSASPPTSTVYKYPFLMTSHDDNTLMRYMVASTEDDLVISPGYRIWGHTAAVAGVSIRRRKAVSVDRRGEIRVWDLQGLMKCVKVKRNDLSTDGSSLVPNGRSGGYIAFGEDEIVLVERVPNTEPQEVDKAQDATRLLVCNFT